MIPSLIALARPQTFMSVDGEVLADSLARVGDQLAVPEPCERTGDRRWKCAVEEDPGSGISGEYLLEMTSDTCWRATRPGYEDIPPETLRGCVRAIDFYWPF